jgi:hypothetical protein
MEDRLKAALNVKSVKRTGRGGGGCINKGETYELDDGSLVFLKANPKDGVSGSSNSCLND